MSGYSKKPRRGGSNDSGEGPASDYILQNDSPYFDSGYMDDERFYAPEEDERPVLQAAEEQFYAEDESEGSPYLQDLDPNYQPNKYLQDLDPNYQPNKYLQDLDPNYQPNKYLQDLTASVEIWGEDDSYVEEEEEEEALPEVDAAPPVPESRRKMQGGMRSVHEDAMHPGHRGKRKKLPDTYAGEERNARFRGGGKSWERHLDNKTVGGSNTAYFDDQEQLASKTRVRDGKLTGQTSGDALDTSKSTGIGTYGMGGRGRFIYAAQGDDLRAVDPWEARRETPMPEFKARFGEEAAEGDEDLTQLEMVNHSSMFGGGSVTGAGEMQVDDGEVRLINDRSGHYKPDNEMLYNTATSLEGKGVDMDKLAIELVNKNAGHHQGRKHGDISARSAEFMSYGGASDAEDQMRSARRAQNPMFEELKAATADRDQGQASVEDRSRSWENKAGMAGIDAKDRIRDSKQHQETALELRKLRRKRHVTGK